jgi:hypothetical protein
MVFLYDDLAPEARQRAEREVLECGILLDTDHIESLAHVGDGGAILKYIREVQSAEVAATWLRENRITFDENGEVC